MNQPEHSKTKLLRAAFEVFSQHGFHGATTKLISKTAQVNEALIMRHFKSKEGLFLAVIEQNLACASETLPYPPQESVEAEFIKFCEYLCERDAQKSDFLRILISHGLQDKAFVCRANEQVMDKRRPLLAERILAFQQAGLIAKHFDPETIESALMHQAFAANFFHRLLAVHNEEETKTTLKTAAAAIAKGLTLSKA